MFNYLWDRGWVKAAEKKRVYRQHLNDLRKQLIALENQPIWDLPGLRSISPSVAEAQNLSRFLVSVNATTSFVQIGLSQAAEGIGQGWAAKKISYASMTVEWAVEQLKSGNYSIVDLISSYFSDGFRLIVAQQIAGDIDPQIASTITLMNTIVEFDKQETQYGEYLEELKNQISRLKDDIEKTERLMEAEHMRLKDIAEKGSAAFCENAAPQARNDSAEAMGQSSINIRVLENDKDPENFPLQMSSIDSATGGRARIYNNHTPDILDDDYIIFVADAEFAGVAEVKYTIKDDLGLSDSAIIRINVSEDPTLQEDFESELDALLNDSVDDFNAQWDEQAQDRLLALEQRLRRATSDLSRLTPERTSTLNVVFELAKIGRDYKDVAAIQCAEALFTGANSQACENITRIVVDEEVQRRNEAGDEFEAGSPQSEIKDFEDSAQTNHSTSVPGWTTTYAQPICESQYGCGGGRYGSWSCPAGFDLSHRWKTQANGTTKNVPICYKTARQ